MAQLRPHPELPVVFVTMEPPQATERFKARTRSPHRFIADPARALYEAFGLARAGFGEVLNRNVTRRLIQAVSAGHAPLGKPGRDTSQMGGTFVIDRRGEVLWAHRSRDIADNAYADDIRPHLPAE